MGGDEGDDGPDLSCFNFGSDSESEGKESASSSKAGSTSSAPDLKKMLKSHRQEEQRLRTVAKEKKFSIPKTDRAARAAADEELEALLADMRKRHEAELAAAGADTSAAVADAVSGMSLGGAGNVASTGTAARKGSKAAKQRARREEAERNRDKRMQDVKDNAGPSLREEELKRLANILSPHGLRVHEIAADGHCMLSYPSHTATYRSVPGTHGRVGKELLLAVLEMAFSPSPALTAGLYRSLAHQLCANSDASSIDFQYCRKLVRR